MSMFLIVSLALLALFAALPLARLAKGRSSGIKSPEDLRTRLCAVDIDAFRNLTDPGEEDFLQTHLSPAVYRRVRRQRLRATLAYVSCVARNAAVLTRMGEEARRSSEVSVAEAGTKLVDNALRLRLQTFRVKTKIYAQMIYPGVATPSGELLSQYEQMTRQGALLGRLQYPGRGVSSAF